MWILVEKIGAHRSPDLLQGLDLSVHHGQLQAWRLWTFGVVRMSWKRGKLQSHLGEDKVYCRIWCQHGRCCLGLLHYELQTFLSTARLRIGELLMFAFCILNKRFFFMCQTCSHISLSIFFSFFFTFIFCFLGKRKKNKKKSKHHFLCSTFFYTLKIMNNSYIFVSGEMSSCPKLQVLVWAVGVKEMSVLWLTICLIK